MALPCSSFVSPIGGRTHDKNSDVRQDVRSAGSSLPRASGSGSGQTASTHSVSVPPSTEDLEELDEKASRNGDLEKGEGAGEREELHDFQQALEGFGRPASPVGGGAKRGAFWRRGGS